MQKIEENNRMGKTRNLFKKIRDTKGTFHAKMSSIKDRNGMDLTEAEEKDKVKFRSSFKGQRNISALLSGAIDIDKKLSISLQPQEVIVLEGVCAGGKKKAEASEEEADDEEDDDDEPRKKKKSKKKSKKKKKAK